MKRNPCRIVYINVRIHMSFFYIRCLLMWSEMWNFSADENLSKAVEAFYVIVYVEQRENINACNLRKYTKSSHFNCENSECSILHQTVSFSHKMIDFFHFPLFFALYFLCSFTNVLHIIVAINLYIPVLLMMWNRHSFHSMYALCDDIK